MFYVLFVCKCVLYYCHRVTTQLQLTNISYNIVSFSLIIPPPLFILHCHLSLLFPFKISVIFLFLFLLFFFNFLFLYTLPFIIFLVSGYHLIFLFVPVLLYFIEHKIFYRFPLSPHLYSLCRFQLVSLMIQFVLNRQSATLFPAKKNDLFRFLKAFRPVVGAANHSVQWAIWSYVRRDKAT